MKKSILSLAILSSLSINTFAQDTSIPKFNQDLKVSAKIDPGCFLTAENINFGVLQMPIQDQSSQSNINVKCSKNASYTISINYDQTSSLNGNNSYYKATSMHSYSDGVGYYLYKDNKILNNGSEAFACTRDNTIVLRTLAIAQELGYGSVNGIGGYTPDTNNICSGYNINQTTLSSLGGQIGGVLKGNISSDTIKYYLETPNGSTVWNVNNKYVGSGNGMEQIIPMKAKIKKSDNVTYRLTPDIYQSTLSVVLTY